jgi:low temperature requirement protein LtrA
VRLVVGSLAGLLAVVALWWCYFDGEDEAAATALAGRPSTSRGLVALVGYDLSHVLMLGGVVAIAGGTRLGLPDLTRRGDAEAAWLIALGAALYLAGLGLFRGVLGHAPWWTRLLAAVCVLAVVPVGRLWGTAEELAALAVVIGVLLLSERRPWRVSAP